MKENIDLTPVQKQIVALIRHFREEKGFPPSIKEIGKAVGLSSSSSVHHQLQNLEKYGYIRRDPARSRSIELVEKSSKNREDIYYYPLVAFAPSDDGPKPEIAVTIPLSIDFVGSRDVFLLEMAGESMKEAGILSGDLLLVRRENRPQEGDIVVARVGQEITVKRFQKRQGYIMLEPENHRMRPVIVKDAEFLGKVTGVLRNIGGKTKDL